MFGMGWAALANVLQLLDDEYDSFEHKGQMVQMPIWPIDDEDAKKLGTATAAYLETMPSKSRVRELLEKHLPLLVFCGTIGEVFGPRAKFSFDNKKKRRQQYLAKLAQANNRGAIGNVQPGAGAIQQNQSTEGANQTDAGQNASGRVETDHIANAFTYA